MAARPLFILFLLAVSSCAAAGTDTLVVGEDYVRPPAGGHRKALLSLFPWSKKKTSYSASDPQQVTARGCFLCPSYFAGCFRIGELK
jgi:acid phosphatase type 7